MLKSQCKSVMKLLSGFSICSVQSSTWIMESQTFVKMPSRENTHTHTPLPVMAFYSNRFHQGWEINRSTCSSPKHFWMKLHQSREQKIRHFKVNLQILNATRISRCQQSTKKQILCATVWYSFMKVNIRVKTNQKKKAQNLKIELEKDQYCQNNSCSATNISTTQAQYTIQWPQCTMQFQWTIKT